MPRNAGVTKAERRRRALLAQKKVQHDRWMAERDGLVAQGKSATPRQPRSGPSATKRASPRHTRGAASSQRTPSYRRHTSSAGSSGSGHASRSQASHSHHPQPPARQAALPVGQGGGGGGGGGYGAPSASQASMYESTSVSQAMSRPADLPPNHAYPDHVLHKLSERITSQLRTELSDHMRREMVLETEKKAELAGKIDSYLQTELQTHTCPVCYELMAPPHKAPMLLFPCGHSFCKQCIDSHTARGANTCPYCREPIQSKAVNHSLKGLIETFIAKRSQFERGEVPVLARRSSATLRSGGAEVMAVRGATPDRAPPAPAQWAGQYPPQSQAMYPAAGGVGGGGGMPQYPGGTAYGPGGYPAPMPPQHGGMPTAYPSTSHGTWQPQYGAGSQPPPTASSYGSGIVLGASATPDGRRPSPIVPPEQSNHDVDQALKYVHDYKSFAMRHEIMKNELHDTRAAVANTSHRAQQAQAMVSQIDQQRQHIETQIANLKQQLERLTSEKQKQEAEMATLNQDQKEAETRMHNVQETMQGLQRDMDKSRLLVENFAPHLLSQLPPETVDNAGGGYHNDSWRS